MKVNEMTVEMTKDELLSATACITSKMLVKNPATFLLLDEFAGFSAMLVAAIFDHTDALNEELKSAKEKEENK
jgi:hypothetical protein